MQNTTMKSFGALTGLLLVALCMGCHSESVQPSQEALPNVLFIAIDDMNDWVGVLAGHPDTITPSIDKLATQGTVFTNAHTQAPLCGPSRASLMTGLRPSTTGIYGQIEDTALRGSHPMVDSTRFLPEYFADAGYKTMGIGKLFHRHAPTGVFEQSGGRVPGFGPKPDQHFHWSQEGTSTDWGAYPDANSDMPDYQSATWAIDRLGEAHDRPFFLAVGFLRPHVPWYAPQEWFDLHPEDSVALPPYREDDLDDISETALAMATTPPMPTTEWAIENGQWAGAVQGYLASISFVDAQVGRVLEALEASAYAENTIVVLFSDHGYHIGEKNRFAKHTLWERATRVPLIFRGPGLRPGQSVSAAAELLDIYPTLLDLAGLPPNPLNDGESLRPLLEDPLAAWQHAAVTTYGRGNHGIAVEGYRYIRYEDGSEEFYDHASDPNEWENRVDDPSYAEIVKRLATHLPANDEPWAEASDIDVYDYFRLQKEQSLRSVRESD